MRRSSTRPAACSVSELAARLLALQHWTRGWRGQFSDSLKQLEFCRGGVRNNLADPALEAPGSRRKEVLAAVLEKMSLAATATADFYLANACADGIPMWEPARRTCTPGKPT